MEPAISDAWLSATLAVFEPAAGSLESVSGGGATTELAVSGGHPKPLSPPPFLPTAAAARRIQRELAGLAYRIGAAGTSSPGRYAARISRSQRRPR